MSGQLPPRRRRIAGERRGATPTGIPTGTPSGTPSEEPTRADDPVVAETAQVEAPPPPPPPAYDDQVETLPPAAVPATEARRGWWGSTASLVVLGVTLVALLAVTGLGLLGLLGNQGVADIREAAKTREAEDTAPSVAERAAEAILAYDYRTLDADQDAAERFMTPDFVKEYSTSFDKAVKPAARTFKAQVTSDVLGSSVVRATPDRVRVLLFVDQRTVATNKKNPQVALNRVEMDMVLRGGSWLVDDITSY